MCAGATVLSRQWKGNHPGPSSTGYHGSDGGPGVGVGAVYLGRVEVDLTIMTSHCKQVATQCRQPYSSTTHVHRTHELPRVGLGVVPVCVCVCVRVRARLCVYMYVHVCVTRILMTKSLICIHVADSNGSF